MTRRILNSLLGLVGIAAAVAAVGPAGAQTPSKSPQAEKAAATLRTPDGKPDLQGTWSFATLTPMERPANLGDKAFFTEKEASDYEKDTIDRNNKDRRDGSAESDVGRAYNDFWWDSGTKVVKSRRTSLVIDPPNGKVPPLIPAARERQTERAAANRDHEFDGPENRPLPERCLILQGAGPPITPTAYNNNVQIVQGPGYVSLLIEMGHEVRVIPTDGRAHLPSTVRQWKGDSRGHWEGDTLVVETTNFTNKSPFRGAIEGPKLIGTLLAEIQDRYPDNLSADDVTVVALRVTQRELRYSFAEKMKALMRFSGTLIRAINPKAERPPLPDLEVANVGGAIFPSLAKRWRVNRNSKSIED